LLLTGAGANLIREMHNAVFIGIKQHFAYFALILLNFAGFFGAGATATGVFSPCKATFRRFPRAMLSVPTQPPFPYANRYRWNFKSVRNAYKLELMNAPLTLLILIVWSMALVTLLGAVYRWKHKRIATERRVNKGLKSYTMGTQEAA
jgi:hypothetical protein